MAPPPATSPPIPTTPGAQYAHQFLNTALSQRGPSALPYSEDVKWLIRNHLVSLAETYPSLHPKTALFTHNDGRAAYLLQADGTIPIVHGGATYNLPVVLWLPEPYPRSPPLVFLSPTRDMVIKPHHPLVDRSGLVTGPPYLRSWVFPSSNLVDLVRSLSHLFGLDPPLFTRSASNPSPNPNPSPIPSPSPAPNPTPSSSRIYSSLAPYGSSGGRFPPSPQLARPPTEDPAEVFKRNAIAKIVESVHADTAAMRRAQEAEMEGLFATQAELRRRGEVIGQGVQAMVDEKEGLEQQLQLVLMNTDLMEVWMRENEGRKRRDAGELEVEEVLVPADVLSRQMLDCTASDLAVEDALYALDKAVQEGAIPSDGYLRSVRALAREQFFHRALSARVRAAQVQAQVSSMAARAPQYAS